MVKEYIDKIVTLATAGTESTIIAVPKNKIGYIVSIEIRNPGTVTAIVDIYDNFTPTGSTTAVSVQKASYSVDADSTLSIREELRKPVFGTVTAKSTVDNTVIYIGLELE